MIRKKWLARLLSLAMFLTLPSVSYAADTAYLNVIKAGSGTQMEETSISSTSLSVGNTETAEAETTESEITLTNIAKQCTITVEAEQTTQGNVKGNLTDGNPSTLWVKDGGGFPATATFALPEQAGKVKKVVAKFESGHSNWSVDVALSVDSQEPLTQTGVKFVEGYEHIFEQAVDANQIMLTLSNPADSDRETAGFWPGLAEVEIWAETTQTDSSSESDVSLSEIASNCTITVPSNQNNSSKLTDGSTGTMWAASSGTWPANVDFTLPGNLLIQKVEIDFEKVANRSMDVVLSRAVNNVTSDYQALNTQTITQSLNETLVYTLDEAQRMTHLRITLSNPNPSTLWPAIAEVRIYAVNEEISLDNYSNISSHAKVTSVGGTHNQADKSNLIDDSYTTVYEYSPSSFADLTGDEGAWVNLDFNGNQQIAGFEVAFEEANDNATFTYDILGKTKRATEWTTYVTDATATRTGDTWKNQHVLNMLSGMSQVRIRVKSCSDTAQLPKLAEVKVFGTYSAPATDATSIAWEKPIHSNNNAATAYLVNDGNDSTSWTANMYPAYVDIDLEENYNLSEIQVVTPSAGYSQYTVYTSMDGRDFELVGTKQNKEACAAGGDKFSTDKEARIVRVYLEYYSNSTQPQLSEVRVVGTPSNTEIQETPEVNITNFADSKYNVNITNEHAIEEVKAIISRNVGADYIDWFTFEIAEAENGYDYFTLSDEGGKIKVTGNNGVSLATGINHYLKYFCNVHISQVGSQVTMPEAVVPVETPIHKETKYPVRYAYNYCTHSYSMSFWGKDEWQQEIDWLALNGVNLVLDITGQEEVWRRFLMDIGYTHQEAKDFLAGPAYYAWAYMANLTGFGGPIHDTWLEERVDMARQNHLTMRKLGMDVVLQAYSGMIPVDLATKHPELAGSIIGQGYWCSFRRPDMLKTDTDTYDDYASLFYQAQEEVFGNTTRFYATDPFHEGGNTGGMSGSTVASALLDSMIDYDSDAVWVIQSWQGNPTNSLLEGLKTGTDRRQHALVLDLYAEKTQNWKSYGVDTDGDGLREFTDTPWVFCQLNNFGGRMGLHGHLDNVANNIPAAANQAKHLAGIGITPEASQNNPLLYDFLFETIWTDDADQPLKAINVTEWLADYAIRRYGAENTNAIEAINILSNTVYKASLNMKGQGAPESVINARPALSIKAASTWGNAIVDYQKTDLEEAAQLLLSEYDTLSSSDAYLYDLTDILKQVLSNTAQEIHKDMADAYNARNLEEFTAQSDKFLELIALNEQILSTRKEFLFGTWTTNASELAANADDFTKDLYLLNAKAIVTTWGSYNQCQSGGLKDYSNRQWAGLTNDFYKVRWEMWIDDCKKVLSGQQNALTSINWFEWEWAYARDSKAYSNQPSDASLKELGQQVLDNFLSPPPGPEASDEFDIDRTTMTASTGSFESSKGESADKVLDDNSGTLWHTAYAGTDAANRWIMFNLGSVKQVNGLRYLPRQNGTNGNITSYKVEVSTDGTTWETVSTGTWANDSSWKAAFFTAVDAQYVKLTAVASASHFASAAEIRITAPAADTGDEGNTDNELDTSTLESALEEARAILENGKRYPQTAKEALNTAVTEAEAILEDTAATQETVDEKAAQLRSRIEAMIEINTTAIDKALIDAQDLLNNGKTYEATSLAALNTAIEEARALLANLAATQEMLNEGAKKLNDQIGLMVEAKEEEPTEKPADTAALNKALTDAQAVLKNGKTYEAASIAALNAAIAEAKALLADKEATQEMLNAGVKKLNDQIGAMVEVKEEEPGGNKPNEDKPNEVVDATALNKALTNAQAVLKNGKTYETASITALNKVINEAKALLANKQATQAMLDAGAKKLNTQIGAMVEVKDTTPTTPTTPTPKPWPFTDIKVNSGWKYDNAKYVYENGIMNGISGTKLFDPDAQVNRAMFATVLHRMADTPKIAYNTKFPDVKDGQYYTSAILWAADKKIVSGMSDGTYGVTQNITRAQIAKMLYEYAKLQKYDISGAASLDSFTDKDKVRAWAVGYLKWA
ncbi:MAG: alpha-N-acetylglucosaminidase C-terminal domain-containing protein, partial [Lachnospiraceae bacterium]|nr:alpha-N-acetylglucosaminidase C-terminal domain-containing protein [Lachnospiraceae bacterium]